MFVWVLACLARWLIAAHGYWSTFTNAGLSGPSLCMAYVLSVLESVLFHICANEHDTQQRFDFRDSFIGFLPALVNVMISSC